MDFNPEQSKAIYSEKPLVLISAGAGSGKTRVLTERFIHLCKEKLEELKTGAKHKVGAEVKEIVAITFTEKAAREMKKRIRDRINDEIGKLQLGIDEVSHRFWKEQREGLDTGFITTFHSFCHKILHQFAFKANLSPSFILIDDTQSILLRNQCFNDIFQREINHKKWKLLYGYYSKSEIRSAVLAIYDQIQENPKYNNVQDFFEGFDAKEIIKIQSTHIDKIRKEILMEFYVMSQECIKEFPPSSTLKGKAKEHVENICRDLEGIKTSDMSTEEFLEILKVIPATHRSYEKSAPSLYILCVRYKAFKEIMKRYTSLPTDRIEDMCKIMDLFTDVLNSFHRIYKEKKDERACLDFSDLQKLAINLLAKNQDIRDFCRKEFKHMMVDEFQDTNGLQMKMLEYINPSYRFIVGDGKQSIYRFRGADVTLMNSLEGVAEKDNQADFIDMGRNYRNCDSIIQFVNELFKVFMIKDSSTMAYGIDYKPLISNRKEEKETHPHKKVELITLEKAEEGEETRFDCEFDLLTERMLEMYNSGEEMVKGKVLVDGEEKERWRRPLWKDLAILIPSRTGLATLEKNLKNKSIPYVVHGGIGFYQKQEIKDMLNILRLINRPWEKVYILSVLRSSLFQLTMDDFFEIQMRISEKGSFADYIYNKDFEKDSSLSTSLKDKLQNFCQLFHRFVPFVPQKSLGEALGDVFEESGLKTSFLIQKNPLQMIKNVEKLMEIMANQNANSLEELLEQVDILASLSDKEGEAEAELPEGNMVHIMTVHASKGLEFPIVCLPKLNRSPQKDKGNFFYDDEYCLVAKFKEDSENDPFEQVEYSTPSYGLVKEKFDVAAFEETKRLFYVATTRARDYLLMTSKGKEAKESWYSLINDALSVNPLLNEYIHVKSQSEILPQNKHMEDEKVFVAKNDIQQKEIPFTFSVSEIMLFMNDPLMYYNNYILKLNPQWLDEGEEGKTDRDNYVVAGTEFGTIVHRACELYDQGFSELDAVNEALESIRDNDVDTELPTYTTRLRKEVLKMLDSYKDVRDVSLGEHIASEWSFVTELSGAYVVGEIDKVFKVDYGYHLMDLKTNILRDEDQLMESYMPQIYLYKMAYEKEMGVEVEEVSLFFMRGGKNGLKTFKADPSYEEKVKTAIANMSRLKRMKAGRKQYI